VPDVPAVYAWYFAEIPGRADVSDCVSFGNLTLLYVGISPKKPPTEGESTSRQNLRTRTRYHYTGNAEGSTGDVRERTILVDAGAGPRPSEDDEDGPDENRPASRTAARGA
jgi:hypothetical protein